MNTQRLMSAAAAIVILTGFSVSPAYSASTDEILERLNDLEWEMKMREIDRENQRLLEELRRRRNQPPIDPFNKSCNPLQNFRFIQRNSVGLCAYLDTQSIKKTSNGTVSLISYVTFDSQLEYPVPHYYQSLLSEFNCLKNLYKPIKRYYWTKNFQLVRTDDISSEGWKKTPDGSSLVLVRDYVCR